MVRCAPVILSLVFACTTARAGGDQTALSKQLIKQTAAQTDLALADAVAQYEWFHAHPELSEQEVKTAARLATELRALGVEVTEGVGGHGLVGVLRGRDARGPVVLYRADMDGLPIQETTGLPYASVNDGVMHGCGHDIHMATALGTMRVLAALKQQWRGTVVFVGQPAEEVGRGARAVLADAKFRKILERVGTPVVALALHDTANLPAGQIAMRAGYAWANVDSVDIVIHGKGGHGARPHLAVDPIVIGADIVMSLQTIVSRRLKPGERAVITVGKFAGGTKHNIIPPTATLLLTVRSYSDETRAFLLQEIARVATQVASAHNAPKPPDVTPISDEFTPSSYNDPTWNARINQVFRRVLGDDRVVEFEPILGGEDFGLYARTLKIPGVQFRLGAVNPATYERTGGKGLPGLHSDKWAPDARPTLRTGILAMSAAILDALRGR